MKNGFRKCYNQDMEKKELRAMIREKSKTLTNEYRQKANAGIESRIMMHPIFQQVETIFCYVSMPEEPDTREIIETAWSMGKRVCVPRCIPGPEHRMEAVIIRSWEDLEPGTLGILEPKQGLPVIDGYKIDLALIPCVSADRFGGRLGHGAGYYDRFLHGQSMYKYCLCFEELMAEQIAGADRVPMDPYDIVMDRIFTEDKVYNPRMASENDGDDSVREALRGSSGLLGKLLRRMLPDPENRG